MSVEQQAIYSKDRYCKNMFIHRTSSIVIEHTQFTNEMIVYADPDHFKSKLFCDDMVKKLSTSTIDRKYTIYQTLMHHLICRYQFLITKYIRRDVSVTVDDHEINLQEYLLSSLFSLERKEYQRQETKFLTITSEDGTVKEVQLTPKIFIPLTQNVFHVYDLLAKRLNNSPASNERTNMCRICGTFLKYVTHYYRFYEFRINSLYYPESIKFDYTCIDQFCIDKQLVKRIVQNASGKKSTFTLGARMSKPTFTLGAKFHNKSGKQSDVPIQHVNNTTNDSKLSQCDDNIDKRIVALQTDVKSEHTKAPSVNISLTISSYSPTLSISPCVTFESYEKEKTVVVNTRFRYTVNYDNIKPKNEPKKILYNNRFRYLVE